MIDLFDGVNNDALLINDCNDNPMPHHWLGDGYCDVSLQCAKHRYDSGDCPAFDRGSGRGGDEPRSAVAPTILSAGRTAARRDYER